VSLFGFGRKRVEVLATSVFIFRQPGLEQTAETKSADHMQRTLAVRALVGFVGANGISKAEEIHLRKSQIVEAPEA
jgi:hypothetical protein